MEASMLLCDFAEDVNGKLYIMGAGWTRLVADQPTPVALAMVLEIPWDQANKPHIMKVALMTEDGEPVAPIPGAEKPLLVEGKIEVGRPPGTKPGSILNAPIALRFNGLTLTEGSYRFEFVVDDEIVSVKSFTVAARE